MFMHLTNKRKVNVASAPLWRSPRPSESTPEVWAEHHTVGFALKPLDDLQMSGCILQSFPRTLILITHMVLK